MARFVLAAGAAAAPSAGFAEWRVASSEHFVIYAEDDERGLRQFSERLERYHSALARFFASQRGVPSPSNRVTVYVVKNGDMVRKLLGAGNASRFIQGFYIPRAGGSLAIIPPVTASRGSQVGESERVLLHEYAHHFQHENFPSISARWFVEGFAEYFASARINSDEVSFGLPAEHRAAELALASEVSMEELLDTKAYEARDSKRFDNFYGRSWALFHYLYSTEERRAQLFDYLQRRNAGESELDAATGAFGDLDALDKALRAYAGKRSFQGWKLDAATLSVGAIEVRELTPAEAASLPVRIRSKRGVNPEQAAEVVQLAREVAAQYPEEPEVQAALAEAEFDAGNDEAAIAAADLALAKNPSHMTALIQKGYALNRIAEETGTAENWAAVRKHFVAVNRIENDHPLPLVYYYRTFVRQGQEPTPAAIDGLKWAMLLAPYDPTLRMMVASQMMADKDYPGAIAVLTPLANSPHIDAANNPARELLDEAKRKQAAGPDG